MNSFWNLLWNNDHFPSLYFKCYAAGKLKHMEQLGSIYAPRNITG